MCSSSPMSKPSPRARCCGEPVEARRRRRRAAPCPAAASRPRASRSAAPRAFDVVEVELHHETVRARDRARRRGRGADSRMRAARASSRAARPRRRSCPRFATPPARRRPEGTGPLPPAAMNRERSARRQCAARALDALRTRRRHALARAVPTPLPCRCGRRVELEPAQPGRALVEREERAARQELRARRRRAQEAHAVALVLRRLVHVAADDARTCGFASMMSQNAAASRSATPSSHVLPIGSGWWCIATSTCWSACAASAWRRPCEAGGPEAACVLAREERAQQHQRPRAAAQLAAELERAAREDLCP